MPVRSAPSPLTAPLAAPLEATFAAEAATGADGAGRPALLRPLPVTRTRAGVVWVGFGAGMLVLAALVVLMAQNTTPVAVAFLGMHGTAPLALMLLIAVVGVAVVGLAVGGLRVGRRTRHSSAWRTAPALDEGR